MWKVTVSIGSLDLEAVGPTEPDPMDLPALPVLTGVRWRDSLVGEGALWPAPQDVSTGTLSVLFETAAEAEFISSATVVKVEFYSDSTAVTPDATFYGRASDPSLAVHDRGVLATIIITDYLADLGEDTVGMAARPAEGHLDRVLAMFTEAGRTARVYDPTFDTWADLVGATPYDAELAARSASATSLLAYLQDLLTWAVVHFVFGLPPVESHTLVVHELGAEVDADGDLLGFGLRPLERDVPAPAPGVMALDGGVWGIAWPESGDALGALAVDANAVAFSATWNRNRDLDTDKVVVVLADQSIRSASHPGVDTAVLRFETQLTLAADADDTKDLYLPDTSPTSSWQADKFTVLLDHTEPGYFPAGLRTLVTLYDLEARHNPEGIPWWHGVVQAREVVLEGSSATVDLTLLPGKNITGYFDGVSDNYQVKFSELDPGLTFDNIDPAIRWVDMAQVRA